MKIELARFPRPLVGLVVLTWAMSASWAQAVSESPSPAAVAAQPQTPIQPPIAAPHAVPAPLNNAANPVSIARSAASASVPRAFTPAATSTVTPVKAWNELSPPQQQALKPLASNWNSIDEAQKRKWLAISRNFGAMTPAEQAKLHSRMSEWVALSPKERTQARLNFAETNRVSPDEKRATWQAYQALSPEEKRKLAAGAPARPTGAAPALKPVPPAKLATPPHADPPRGGASSAALLPASAASAHRQIDQKTLLPRKPASAP